MAKLPGRLKVESPTRTSKQEAIVQEMYVVRCRSLTPIEPHGDEFVLVSLTSIVSARRVRREASL